MKYSLLFFLLIVSIYSCNNKQNNNTQKKSQKESIQRNPKLFPLNLQITSKSHNIILNTNLFDKYSLQKGQTVKAKDEINNSSFTYTSNFIEFLPKSKFENPDTYGAEDNLKFNISFECPECLDATIVRYDFNSKELITDNSLKEFLNDPSSISRKIRQKGILFISDEDISFSRNGLIGIYLVLRDIKKELFIYEIIGSKSDGMAPSFLDSESCLFEGDDEFEGMVCITTKQFEGDDYSGYNVPLKGMVYGDVASININGKNIKFKKGEFYKRMNMKLRTGYNQIPIIIKDKYSNTTESYIEVTLSRIKDDPDIYIDNNIDIEN